MQNIYLIDGYNLIYRMFYAVPPFTTKAGQPVNAVFGIARMILGLHSNEKPDLLYFVMDARGPSFRSELYADYKATRDRMPSDLKTQEELIFELLKAFQIPIVEKMGYEADDVIGTLVTDLRKDPENRIFILSGDKDLYQFIGGEVAVYDTMKRKIARRADTIEKFGVDPEHVVDYLAITGDSSDNIPGITGFWPKKAQSLIGEFGSLENIYAALDAGHPSITGKTETTLREQREVAFLSKKLATIPTDVPLDLPDGGRFGFAKRKLMNPEVQEFFRKMEFKSLLGEEETPLATYESLKLSATPVRTQEELQEIEQKLVQEGSCSIGTILSNGNLVGLALYIAEKPYTVDFTQISGANFLKFLLESEIEIIGYDLKEELKHIYRYLENSSQVGEEQMGLVF